MDKIYNKVNYTLGCTVSIENQIKMLKMKSAFKITYEKLSKHIELQGESIDDSSILFAKYINIDWEERKNCSMIKSFFQIFTKEWDMEIGISTKNKLKGNDFIKSTKTIDSKYIEAIHYGSYNKLGKTYSKLMKYIKNSNLKFDNYSLEIYVNNPDVVAQSELITKILIPIK
jgi:effector-binding domain-containing protein